MDKKAEGDIFVNQLIDAVYSRRGIWDKKDLSHRMCTHLWKHVARELDRPVLECKDKWKNLMDAFRANFRKVVNSLRPGQNIEKSLKCVKWRFFQKLMFLRESVNVKRITDSDRYKNEDYNDGDADGIKNDIDDVGDDDDEEEVSIPDINDISVDEPSIFKTLNSFPSDSSSSNESHSQSLNSNKRVTSSISKSNFQPSISLKMSSLLTLQKQMDTVANELTNSDPSSRFGKYVADLHRDIPVSKRRKFELEVIKLANELIDEKELENNISISSL